METINRKISLEPYITRFPVCWPALKEGEIHYLNLYSDYADMTMANYGKMPLGISESAIHDSYREFSDEMFFSYKGKVLPYYTLQQWFNHMISYRKILYSNECHGKFDTMEDYYTESFKDGGMLEYARNQDELYILHGGDRFYEWLTDNYFVLLDLNTCYDEEREPDITSNYTYSEWQDIIINLGGPLLTFPEAFVIYSKMREWKNKYSDKDCKKEYNCCECVKYNEYGGDIVFSLLESWIYKIQSKVASHNDGIKMLDEPERLELYPKFDISATLKSKIDDLSVFSTIASDFIPGHLYSNGNICVAEEDVWILNDYDEYCEDKFDNTKWMRYYDYYKSLPEHQDEFIEQSQIPNASGRTVSSLDSFLRTDDTIDGIGNALPGYFKPFSGSTFVQPAENDVLDLIYAPGTCANTKIVIDNGAVKASGDVPGNVFEGDVLQSIRFYCKKINGDEYPGLSVTVYENDTPVSAITWIEEQMSEIDESENGPTDGIIYANFKYYKGCTYTIDDSNKVVVSGETYVECTDHCILEKTTCQYHVSERESYPLIYYKVIKDTEIRYSEEQGDYVEVCMCDFSFKPSNLDKTPVAITPVFRKEEMLPFCMTETPVDNIYIDRGYTTVLDRHFRIGEVNNYEQLEKYGNGIFQIFNADEEVV